MLSVGLLNIASILTRAMEVTDESRSVSWWDNVLPYLEAGMHCTCANDLSCTEEHLLEICVLVNVPAWVLTAHTPCNSLRSHYTRIQQHLETYQVTGSAMARMGGRISSHQPSIVVRQ
jgi:hypothetical protein